VLRHYWLGDRKGIQPAKELGVNFSKLLKLNDSTDIVLIFKDANLMQSGTPETFF